MKNGIMIMFLLVGTFVSAQGALGEVIGTVLEKKTQQSAYGAVAFIEDHGRKYQARVNEEGRFRISAIPSGRYILQIRHKGDTMPKKFVVDVPMDGFFQLGTVAFVGTTLELDIMNATYDRNGLRMIDGNLPVNTLTSEEIEKSPLKNDIKGLLSTMTTDIRQTSDGELVFRGARKGDMLYLMDGVKTSEIGSVPSSSIGRMMVYSGGLPAKYGDTMGGVVVMESKSYFDLYRRWEASQIRSGKK